LVDDVVDGWIASSICFIIVGNCICKKELKELFITPITFYFVIDVGDVAVGSTSKEEACVELVVFTYNL